MLKKESRATVLMRLEDANEALGFEARPQRLERGFALGGVVTVIIEHRDHAAMTHGAFAQVLHAPIKTKEVSKRSADGTPLRAEPVRQDGRRGTVECHVVAGHAAHPTADSLTINKDGAESSTWIVLNVVVSAGRPTERRHCA